VIVGQPVTPMITERSQIYGLCLSGTPGREYQIVEVKAGETQHPLGTRRQRIEFPSESRTAAEPSAKVRVTKISTCIQKKFTRASLKRNIPSLQFRV
jgi:hypothetical protein